MQLEFWRYIKPYEQKKPCFVKKGCVHIASLQETHLSTTDHLKLKQD